MIYRTLGKTGAEVSVVGVGTWQFGGEWGVEFEQTTVDTIFRTAKECGINLIDTAECYGPDHLSESLVGNAIAQDRDDWFLATKFGHHYDDKFTRSEHRTATDVTKQLEDSLRALKTDVIDLYQYHSWADDEVFEDDVQAALLKAKDQGKVRFLGNSVRTQGDPIPQIRQSEEMSMEAIQIVFNRLQRNPEEGAFEICQQQNLGVMARVPLASGYLSGKYKPGHQFNDTEVRGRRDKSEQRNAWLTEAQTIQKDEVPDGVNMAQWAIAWCLKNPAVHCVIPGVKNADQVRSNAAAVELL